MYGLGVISLTYPTINTVDEWWAVCEDMTFGIISGASGASGVVMLFFGPAMLSRYNYKTILRVVAVRQLFHPALASSFQRVPATKQRTMAKTD